MRDIFDEVASGERADPMALARRSVAPQVRRRFYQAVTVREAGGSFEVELDGRPVRTPARNPLAAPTAGLGAALVAEWDDQREAIDPAAMPLTRLANAVIDRVAGAAEPVAGEVLKYLGADLLFYRAASPDGLVARQAAAWDPVLGWARDSLGARFILAEGLTHVQQPERAVAAAAATIPAGSDIRSLWRLGAVSTITTLTGSALLALALMHGAVTPDAVWAAAHVDEDWNMERWGRDDLALDRRAFHEREMRAAATVLAELRD